MGRRGSAFEVSPKAESKKNSKLKSTSEKREFHS